MMLLNLNYNILANLIDHSLAHLVINSLANGLGLIMTHSLINGLTNLLWSANLLMSNLALRNGNRFASILQYETTRLIELGSAFTLVDGSANILDILVAHVVIHGLTRLLPDVIVNHFANGSLVDLNHSRWGDHHRFGFLARVFVELLSEIFETEGGGGQEDG